jgi:hypothetical protein
MASSFRHGGRAARRNDARSSKKKAPPGRAVPAHGASNNGVDQHPLMDPSVIFVDA